MNKKNRHCLELCHMTKEEKKAYNKRYYQLHKDYWVNYYGYGITEGRDRAKDYKEELKKKILQESKEYYLQKQDPFSYANTRGATTQIAKDKNNFIDNVVDAEYKDDQTYQSKYMKNKLNQIMNSNVSNAIKREAVVEYGKRKVDQIIGDITWGITKISEKIKSLGSDPFR